MQSLRAGFPKGYMHTNEAQNRHILRALFLQSPVEPTHEMGRGNKKPIPLGLNHNLLEEAGEEEPKNREAQ